MKINLEGLKIDIFDVLFVFGFIIFEIGIGIICIEAAMIIGGLLIMYLCMPKANMPPTERTRTPPPKD